MVHSVDAWAPMSKDPKLFTRVITFELRPRYINVTDRRTNGRLTVAIPRNTYKGVGTAGAMGALAPAMLKPRGRKFLFSPAIIWQVHHLVDSQTSISLYSFKILMRIVHLYIVSFTVRSLIFNTRHTELLLEA